MKKSHDANGIVTTRIAATPCPRCGKTLDAATSTDGARPTPGDCTICLYCDVLLVFDKKRRPCIPTAAELVTLEREQPKEIARARDFTRAFRRMKNTAVPTSLRVRKARGHEQ